MTRIQWRNVKVGMGLRGADGHTYAVTSLHRPSSKWVAVSLERPGRKIEKEFPATGEVELVTDLPPEAAVEIKLTEFAEDQGVDVRHVAAAMVLAGFPGSTIEADGDASVSPPDPRAIACPEHYKDAGTLASHLSILHGVAMTAPRATRLGPKAEGKLNNDLGIMPGIAAPTSIKATDLRSLRECHQWYHDYGRLDPVKTIEPGGRVHVHDDPLYLSRFANPEVGRKT